MVIRTGPDKPATNKYTFQQNKNMPVDPELLAILACPKCKGDLEYDKENEKLICWNCRLRFPIIDGEIPDMLLEDAEKF
jgi:hypothetical protein